MLIATHNQAGLLPKVGQDAKKRASTGVTMCFSDRCRYPGWRLQELDGHLVLRGARQILARLRPSCQRKRKVLIATQNQAVLLPKVGQDAKKRASTGVTMCFSDRCRYPGWRLQELDGHLVGFALGHGSGGKVSGEATRGVHPYEIRI